MCSATSSHSPFGLHVYDPNHFFSDPSPRNDQCQCWNLFVYPATEKEFAIHNSLFSLFLHTMSLYIDMKMIRPVNCLRFTLHFVHQWLTDTAQYRELDRTDGEPMEFEWNIFPGFTTLQILAEIQKMDLLFPCVYGLWMLIHLAKTQH